MKTAALILAMHALAIADGHTTRRTHALGYGELNPVVRPVAGSPAVYVVVSSDVVLADYLLLKHRHSKLAKAAVAECLVGHGIGVAVNEYHIKERK